MSTSINLHVIQPPITPDHVMCVLSSAHGSGFFRMHNTAALLDKNPDASPEDIAAANLQDERLANIVQAAQERIRLNDDLAARAAATHAMRGLDASDSLLRSPDLQLCLLAPSILIANSREIPEGSPFWTLFYEVRLIDFRTTGQVLDAMRVAQKSPRKMAGATRFLAEHLGKPMLILGE